MYSQLNNDYNILGIHNLVEVEVNDNKFIDGRESLFGSKSPVQSKFSSF